MSASEASRRVKCFVEIPHATAPGFVAALLKAFAGRVERDHGAKSPSTSDIVKTLEGERVVELVDELERRGTELFVSRRPYGRYRKVFQPEQVIAFVREPLSRVIAHWEAAKERGNFTGTLLEFAEAPARRNVQSRLLQGLPLRRLALLGSSEEYRRSVNRLRAVEGFSKLAAELARATLQEPKYEPNAEELAALRDLNGEDLELFERARNIVRAQKAAHKVAAPKKSPAEREAVRKERLRRAMRAAKRHAGPYAVGPLPMVSKEHQLALLFTPKAGCTFAVKWYLDQLGLLGEAEAYGNWIHDYRQEVFYAREAYRPDDIALPGMRVLKFVRNPFDRAVSSYVHANRMGYEDSKVQAFLGRPVTPERRYSFREFISYLESIDLYKCNAHHQKQVHALEVAGLVEPTHLIRIEESKHVVPALERELALKETDLKRLSSSRHHTERSADETFCGDRALKLGRGNITLPGNRAFYDADLAQRVAQLYAEDFARYGYSTKLD